MASVKCRDTYTHSNQYNSNGAQSANGYKDNGTQSNGGDSSDGRHTYNNRTNTECCCNAY